MYSDPSGELLVPVLIGAAVAAASYTVTALTADVPFTAGGLIKATVIGGISGAMTFGIGEAASSITQLGARISMQAVAHGMTQGVMTGIQGGNFWQGAASGALASIGASAWGSLGGNFARSGAGQITFGTVSGGAGAALTGGNFWEGAAIGLVVSALNHALHHTKPKPDVTKMDKNYKTGSKAWEYVKGRYTITTKKEILQWDSKKGEVEVYNKAEKKHKGGFDPYNRKKQISKGVQGRVPNGGWKINTSRTLNLSQRVYRLVPQLRVFEYFVPIIPISPFHNQQPQGGGI